MLTSSWAIAQTPIWGGPQPPSRRMCSAGITESKQTAQSSGATIRRVDEGGIGKVRTKLNKARRCQVKVGDSKIVKAQKRVQSARERFGSELRGKIVWWREVCVLCVCRGCWDLEGVSGCGCGSCQTRRGCGAKQPRGSRGAHPFGWIPTLHTTRDGRQ